MGVYDTSAQTVKLYVNGSLEDTDAWTGSWAAAGAFVVGRGLWNGASTDWVSGTIDSVRAYQSALSASQVTALHNDPTPTVTFTEATMTAGITGALQGAQHGQQSTTAVAFAGTTNASNGTAVAGPAAFTIECWFKSTSATGGLVVGFADTRNSTPTAYDRLIYLDSGNRLTFGTRPSGSALTVRSTGTNPAAPT